MCHRLVKLTLTIRNKYVDKKFDELFMLGGTDNLKEKSVYINVFIPTLIFMITSIYLFFFNYYLC